MKPQYRLAVTGIKSDDLSSIIDLVHDVGGEIADFSIEHLKPRTTRRVPPGQNPARTLNADTHTKRSKNLKFKVGTNVRIKELALIGGRNTVMGLARKYAATQPHGICKRAKFQAYVVGHDTGLSDSGISPTVSWLLNQEALVELPA